MIAARDLYCCLLLQCEALRTCRWDFPIATALLPMVSSLSLNHNRYSIVHGWPNSGSRAACGSLNVCIRDERSHIFQTPHPLLLHALRLLLLLRLPKILKHQLRLLFTLRKLPSNSYQKDSVYFASWGKIHGVAILPLIEHKWCWSGHVKSTIQRYKMLRFSLYFT